MLKLKVKKINNKNEYVLEDVKNGFQYKVCLCFYSKDLPKVGDELLLSEKLFDKSFEEFCQPYFFGELEDQTGRDAKNLKDHELLSWTHNGKKFLLKRLYG